MASPLPTGIDVLPVERVAAERIRPLFEAERTAWRRRLGWECAASPAAMLRAIEWGVVRGSALLDGGRPVGLLVHQPSSSVTRFCGALLPADLPGAAVPLVASALATVPAGTRIEGQLTVFEGQHDLDAAFRRFGFSVEPRDFLALDERMPSAALPPGFLLEPLAGDELSACARLLVEAHAGSVEARINEVFRTETAAMGYLRDLVDTRACGRVDGGASAVVRRGGRAVAFTVASWTAAGVGHVPQIAVAPRYQGQGLGLGMLAHAVGTLREGGASRVTLSTTRSNARAAAWYAGLGFRPLTTFSAYHRDQSP